VSVPDIVTLVVTPLAVGCIAAAQHWWYRRCRRADLARMRAGRDRHRAELGEARQLAERFADGLNEAIAHLDEGRPEDARAAAERALAVSAYEGELLRTRRALRIVAAENALLRRRLGSPTAQLMEDAR